MVWIYCEYIRMCADMSNRKYNIGRQSKSGLVIFLLNSCVVLSHLSLLHSLMWSDSNLKGLFLCSIVVYL